MPHRLIHHACLALDERVSLSLVLCDPSNLASKLAIVRALCGPCHVPVVRDHVDCGELLIFAPRLAKTAELTAVTSVLQILPLLAALAAT